MFSTEQERWEARAVAVGAIRTYCDTWSFWRLNNSWERKVARTANNCSGQKKSCTHRIRQNWSQWGYSVWKLDTPLSAKCLCIHWDSFIVSNLLISERCVTFVRMERWQICDRKEMEIVSGFGSAVGEGRGAKLCINEIDNQLVRSESMQNSKTQRGNKHLCESSWTN